MGRRALPALRPPPALLPFSQSRSSTPNAGIRQDRQAAGGSFVQKPGSMPDSGQASCRTAAGGAGKALTVSPADQRGATVWQRRRARCPQSALHPATLAGMRSSEGCHGKQEGFLKAGRTVAAVRQSGLARWQAVLCRLIAGSFFGPCRRGACAWIRVALELLRQAVYTYSVEMHNLPLGCRAESDRLAWRTLWRASYRQGYSLF